MKKRYTLLAALISSLFVGCSGPQVSGHVDETDTGIQASLVNVTGEPVRNASVRVFTHMDSTGMWEDSVITDENGFYTVPDLEPGRYSLWAETDTSLLYLQSVSVAEDTPFSSTDTLRAYRSVAVPVKVQPNHDPRTVEVQIWGTPIRHNVNAQGLLELKKIPEGVYFTRLTSTREGYSPTNDTIVIQPDSKDTLTDTLELIYTGIPAVSGIEASFDTLSSVATISWNATEFRDLDAYLVYRDPVDAVKLSDTPVGYTRDTVFSDEIPLSESQKFVYRVKIRANNEGKEGAVFYKDTIDYVNPKEHLSLIEKEADRVSMHHKYEFSYNTPVWIGEVKSVLWTIPEAGLSGSGEAGRISFTLSDHLTETLLCEVTMTGTNGRVLKDSLELTVASDIVKVEGKSGVPGIGQPVVLETTAFALASPTLNRFEIWRAEDGITWEQVTVLDDRFVGKLSNIAVHNNSLWLVSAENKLFRSSDGITWEYETTLLAVTPEDISNTSNALISFNEKLYIFSEVSIPNEYSSRRTLIEYGSEAAIIPLTYGTEAPANSVTTGYGCYPFIHNGELYTQSHAGLSGTNIEKYELGTSAVIHNTKQKWSSGFFFVPVQITYKGGIIVRDNSNSYDYLPKSSLVDGISDSYPGIALHFDYESKKCFEYQGKLIMIGNSEIYTDGPIGQ